MKPIKNVGDRSHPISKGYTCEKGRNLIKFYSTGRMLFPRINSVTKNWDYVIDSLGGGKIKKLLRVLG